jgi:hypothetical protein
MQPEKIKNNVEFRERLEAIAPDAILVVAYGRIIPQWMLELPRFGVHQSAWVAAAEVPRRGADSVGRGQWRNRNRGYDHGFAGVRWWWERRKGRRWCLKRCRWKRNRGWREWRLRGTSR